MNSLGVILFLIYSVVLIFIKNIYVIAGLILIEFVFLILRKVRVRIRSILIFTTFVFLINFFLTDFLNALLIFLRLFSMYLGVILLVSLVGINNIAKTFGNIFHSKEIYLIISLALTFLPIMKTEVVSIRNSLVVKNYQLNLQNVLKNPKVYVIAFVNSLFLKVDNLEKVITSMGFEE